MSEHAFPLIVDHEREYLAGDVIRKAVEHDAATMRFYLTCSVGELAQRVLLALTVPPASAPAATPEPDCPTCAGHTFPSHISRDGTPICGKHGAIPPAAPTGEEAGPGFHFTEPRRCVECEGCGFAFDATHRDDDATGKYSCPVCAESAQATALAALRARVEELEADRFTAEYAALLRRWVDFHDGHSPMEEWTTVFAKLLEDTRAALAPRQPEERQL